MTAKQATTELLAEVRGGRLDAGAVDAVLAAAGQSDGTGASTRSTVTLLPCSTDF